jgi:hypothetical protein
MSEGVVTVEWFGGPHDGERFTIRETAKEVFVLIPVPWAGEPVPEAEYPTAEVPRHAVCPIVRGRRGNRYAMYPKSDG